MHPIVLLILLVAVLMFVSWIKRAPPQARTKALVTAGVVVLVVLALAKGQWLVASVGTLLALGHRLLAASQLFNTLKSMRGPTPGKTSDVETSFLRMSLNHDTGEMDGKVVKGDFRGRALSDLSLVELQQLRDACLSEDRQSVAVLEAYLDRRFGQDWREDVEASTHTAGSAGGSMSMDEAREVLGVSSGANREEIVDAHRRLMQRLHPDRGGSTYLAAKINQAKDLLLDSVSPR